MFKSVIVGKNLTLLRSIVPKASPVLMRNVEARSRNEDRTGFSDQGSHRDGHSSQEEEVELL